MADDIGALAQWDCCPIRNNRLKGAASFALHSFLIRSAGSVSPPLPSKLLVFAFKLLDCQLIDAVATGRDSASTLRVLCWVKTTRTLRSSCER